MRTLTSTLLAAQKAPVRQDAVVCTIVDAPVEWPRWSWSAIYGPTETDGPSAIVQLFSGPLVRARQTTGGAIYTQKVTDPGQAGQWSSWTLWKAAATTSLGAGIALASRDTSDSLRLFYVDLADGRTIRCATSTDGTTWTEETVYVEPSPRQVRGL